MNTQRLIPIATLTLSIGLLSACSPAADPADGAPRISIAGLLGQDTTYDEAAAREQEAQVQELIATCMAEQGWEYIPAQQPASTVTYTDEDELERRQREGYGIAYWALNTGTEPVIDPGNEWVDPNTAIVEAMSESERDAYYVSLYGDGTDGGPVIYASESTDAKVIDPGGGNGGGSMYGGGCMGTASEAVYGQGPVYSEDYYTALNRFYEELNTRVMADPTIKALDGQWSTCMAEAGYDFAGPNTIWETAVTDFQTRFNDIVGDLYSRDPFEGWTHEEIDAFFATATQEEIDAKFNVSYELTDDQRSGLEALLADEIELAVAEFPCSQAFNTDYQAAYADIEEAYATEHRAELEALAASAAAGE